MFRLTNWDLSLCVTGRRARPFSVAFMKATPLAPLSFFLLSLQRTGCFPFSLSFLLVVLKSDLFPKIEMWLMKEALVEITHSGNSQYI